MFNQNNLEKLKENWGIKADTMSCNAEIRLFDPLSHWQCYVLALNPEDNNTIVCIISTAKNQEACLTEWTLYDLNGLYNSEGEHPEIDKEYRPRQACEVFKSLNKEVCYESRRD